VGYQNAHFWARLLKPEGSHSRKPQNPKEEESVKKNLIVNVSVVLLLTLAAVKSGYAQSNSESCNNKLIAGTYGFTVQGNKLGGPGPVGPQVGVAMTEFDGNGGLSQIDTITIGGHLVSDFSHPRATGTYTVNSDCTGTFTLNFADGRPTVVVNFVVVNGGAEIDTVVISAGGNQGILATSSVGKRRAAKH
jgi:hypothetical protein